MTGFRVEAIGDWTRSPPVPPNPGFRKDRGGAGVWAPMLASGSYVEQALPTSQTLDANSAAIVAYLDQEMNSGVPASTVGSNTRPAIGKVGMSFSTGPSSPDPLLYTGQPLRSVALVASTGGITSSLVDTTGGAGNYVIKTGTSTNLKARMLAYGGVPIADNYQAPGGSHDNPYCIYNPGWSGTDAGRGDGINTVLNGQMHELFQFAPAGTAWDAYVLANPGKTPPGIDPRAVNGMDGQPMRWECQSGSRVSGTKQSPGYPHDRYVNAAVGTSQFDICEDNSWGVSASHNLLLALMILPEDVDLWMTNLAAAGGNPDNAAPPPHAWGFANYWHSSSLPADPAGFRWPSQGRDATAHIDFTNGVPIVEGMRFKVPRNVVVNNITGGTGAGGKLHPLAQMLVRQSQEHGCMNWDGAGSITARADPAIAAFFNGVQPVKVLQGFPWLAHQCVKTGTELSINP